MQSGSVLRFGSHPKRIRTPASWQRVGGTGRALRPGTRASAFSGEITKAPAHAGATSAKNAEEISPQEKLISEKWPLRLFASGTCGQAPGLQVSHQLWPDRDLTP